MSGFMWLRSLARWVSECGGSAVEFRCDLMLAGFVREQDRIASSSCWVMTVFGDIRSGGML